MKMIFAKNFVRYYEKNNTWNIRRLVDESFVPVTQRPSELYWRFSDFKTLLTKTGRPSAKIQFLELHVSRLCREKGGKRTFVQRLNCVFPLCARMKTGPLEPGGHGGNRFCSKNPTIFNIICGLAERMGWTTHQPSVWCFFFIISSRLRALKNLTFNFLLLL